MESLYIAASGMHAQQTNLDVVANNLANVNTPGFKKSRVDFEDLVYRAVQSSQNPEQRAHALGLGAAISTTAKVFTPGDLKKTDRSLDLGIQGYGFFEVTLPDNTHGYTRSGSFQVDRDGYLVTSDGHQLNPSIQIPSDAQEVLFGKDGAVFAKVPSESAPIEIGQLELANFANASGLNPIGSNLYLANDASGTPQYSKPGEDGTGGISQGFLEASNVQLVEELTNMIMAQRSFEMNSKVVQASDEMLGIINNLRR